MKNEQNSRVSWCSGATGASRAVQGAAFRKPIATAESMFANNSHGS